MTAFCWNIRKLNDYVPRRTRRAAVRHGQNLLPALTLVPHHPESFF